MADSAGRLTDRFNVDKDGGASYAFDLKVPPGTAGMAPSLGIAYNSGGSDGLMGVGWGLSGLSSITRVGRTVAQDGAHGAVLYDSDDRFALDGQRLMAVSGAYGQPQAVYHTEIQSWRKVVPNYPSGWDARHGPQSFTVHTREGEVWEYGTTVDSRVPASSQVPAIRLWSLSRVTDRHGNFMTVTYELDAQNNAHYPKRIDYTDNVHAPIARKRQVQFGFVDHPNATTTYVGGHPIRITRLLSQVQTFIGDSLVRTYRFAYLPSNATGRPLLQSVSTQARDTSLPPTTFTWQGQTDAAPTLLQPARALGKTLQGGLRISMDVSGNGLTDVLHAYHTQQQLRLDLYLSTRNGLEGPHAVDLQGATLAWGGTFHPLDVDADGHMDLVYAANNGGKLGLTLFKATERSGRWTLVRQGPVHGAGPDHLLWGGTLLSLDVDGDGRTDLVYATNKASMLELAVLYSSGNAFAPSSSGPTTTSLPFGGRLLPLDLRGRGKTDLVYATQDNGFMKLTWLEARAGREGFQPQSTPLLPADARIPWGGSLIPIHLNGDGQVDLLNPYTQGGTLHLRALHNTGTGFVVQDLGATGLVYGAAIPQLIPADVTGSGRDDLVLVGEYRRDGESTSRRLAVLVNEAGKLRFHEKVSQLPAFVATGESTTALGLTGTGKADLLHVDGSGAAHLLAATVDYPDLVSSLTNGLGGRFELTYKPLTDPAVYTRTPPSTDGVDTQALFNNQLSGATYALATNPGSQSPEVGMSFASRSIQYPRYVVSGYAQVYSSTQRYTHALTYAGARLSLQGRGWLGFAAWTKSDPHTGAAGVVTETRYHQEFPRTYAVDSQTVRRASDQALMARSEYEYATPSSAGVHQLQTLEVRRKLYTFAASDTPDCVRTKAFQYDDYGNAISITLTSTGVPTAPLYTWQSFQNDVARHRFGLLTERRLSADPLGHQPLQRERLTYDASTGNLQTRSRWSQGEAWQVYTYRYDEWGNRTRVEDPTGAVVTTHFESTYRTFPSKRELPAKANERPLEVTFEYDAALGALTSQTHASGGREVHLHDGLGRLVETQRTGPDGDRVVPTVLLRRGQDATGIHCETRTRQEWGRDVWTVRTEYLDGFGRVTRTATQGMEDGALVGRAIQQDTVHDAHDQPVEQTLPYFQGDTPTRAQALTHDEYERVVRREAVGVGTAPLVTTYAYPRTNRVLITEGAASSAPRTRTLTHGFHGETQCLAEVEDGQGHVTRFTHDALGRRLSATDPKVETTFAYDGLDRHVAITTRSGSTTFTRETYAYQDDLRRWTHTDGTGLVTTFQLDALRRMESKQVGSETTTYRYDEATSPWSRGLLTGVRLPDGTGYAYGHDPDGNTTSVELTLGGTRYTLGQTFTPTRLVSRIVYPDAARTEVRYQRDSVARLTKILEGEKAHLTQSDFSALGAPAVAHYGNGVRADWTYTADGHLLTQDIRGHDERPLSATSVEWNAFWQVEGVKDRLEPSLDQDFAYDPLGQLLRAQGGGHGLKEYAYDAACSLVLKDGLTMERAGHQVTAGFSPALPDALQARYDANGSLVELKYQGTTTQFSYDGERRLQQAGDVRFAYDQDGRRLMKAEPGLTTYYVAPCYEVVVFPGGARQHTRYVQEGEHLVASVTVAESGTPPGGPPGVPTPGTRYFHVNHTRSTTLVTNEQGRLASALDYDPFGTPRLRSGADDFRHKYTGLELDSTGLYHASSRYYSPLLGGFITADTQLGAGEERPGAFNRYAYVLNDPLTLIDPSGFGLFGSIKNFFTNTLPNWVSRNWEEIVSYAVDIALIAGGIALSFVPGLQGVAALAVGVAVGGLVGAGLGGLAYNISTSATGKEFSWGDWGTQVGIGAAAGAIGGGFSAAGELAAVGLNLANKTLLNIGLRAGVDLVGGVVSGVSSQLIGNAVAGAALGSDLAFAAVFGGVGGAIGSLVSSGSKAALSRVSNSIDEVEAIPSWVRRQAYNVSGSLDAVPFDVDGMRQVVTLTLGGTFGTSLGYTLSYLHAEQFFLPGMK
ncbi:FG-GAP-like repeat-containing protein [Myxococcus sp. K15C18031901]|uniref:RHS repeat-associated core domain-containing protein n=1 Tax=Myxococcus dinghuensis TaxID=2906761 RepID=UPI0020A8365B|nr:RHS repeat-associated core domain-containing protein [Myxococcus dinghuensis]MCP3100017.1 FG-GAP-like repeat-containing protein [Myxococcus dinghuensis]